MTVVNRNLESLLVVSTFTLCTLYGPALQLMLWCWIKTPIVRCIFTSVPPALGVYLLIKLLHLYSVNPEN